MTATMATPISSIDAVIALLAQLERVIEELRGVVAHQQHEEEDPGGWPI